MALRRRIYLTMVSSLSAEEMAHKMLSSFSGQCKEVSHMMVESCAHERSYRKQYGLLAERLCKISPDYEDALDVLFARQYEAVHLLDTNKIRNVAKFFAHLLFADALDWTALEMIELTEGATNPSKRIFIKILFQELASFMGAQLRRRLLGDGEGEEGALKEAFKGLFPMHCDANPKDTRFAINFFTTIGLGGLTEGMRAFLRRKHKEMVRMQAMDDADSDDDDDDDSSSGSDSDSDSSSSDASESSMAMSRDERKRKRRRAKSKSR